MKKAIDQANAQKPFTLQWLQDIYFRLGATATVSALRGVTVAGPAKDYVVLRKDEGIPTSRTDVAGTEGIEYVSFNPPLWEWPYSILRTRFEQKEKRAYLHHCGEEFLIPISGKILYHFFWTPGARPPKRTVMKQPLQPGSATRIDPQTPHHTWAVDDTGAEAWMIFRDISGSASAINLDLQSPIDFHLSKRQVTEQDLKQDGRYALFAWGLSERLRHLREKANLRVGQVASACGIDSSHLSRIENGDTNVSLQTLMRISQFLRLDVMGLLMTAFARAEADSERCWQTVSIPPPPRKSSAEIRPHSILCDPPLGAHSLHLEYILLNPGPSREIGLSSYNSPTSWIVLDGEIILSLKEGLSNPVSQLLDSGTVIHMRNPAAASVQCLKQSTILVIRCSDQCPRIVE